MPGFGHFKVVEEQGGEKSRADHTDQNPGLEFTPFGLGVVDNRSDKGIDDRIEDTKEGEHNTNDGETAIGEGNNIGQVHHKIHTYQRVERISSDCTETEENFIFSKEILDEYFDKDYKIAFVTNDFHIFRSSRFAHLTGFKDATHAHSNTTWYTVVPNGLRECITVLKLLILDQWKY